MKRHSILIFGQIHHLLNIHVTQIKTIDEQNIIICGIRALCTVILIGSIATPIAGGSILAVCSAKAISNYRKVLPNLIYEYIFKELQNKCVINDHYQI